MDRLVEFVKAAPAGFEPSPRCTFAHDYKYFVSGKGCTLGVLFEDTFNVYFEWLMEEDRPADFPPHIRYKAWPKAEFTRLMGAGVWEPTCTP